MHYKAVLYFLWTDVYHSLWSTCWQVDICIILMYNLIHNITLPFVKITWLGRYVSSFLSVDLSTCRPVDLSTKHEAPKAPVDLSTKHEASKAPHHFLFCEVCFTVWGIVNLSQSNKKKSNSFVIIRHIKRCCFSHSFYT